MPDEPDDAHLAAAWLAGEALRSVQTPDGRVRVEDYLTVLAAATGEAALVAAATIDVEQTDLAPGSPVFADAINVVLSGDATVLGDVPADSVVGILAAAVVPGVVPADAIEPVSRWYEHVASHVGAAPWGQVALSVGAEHEPSVMPLRAAYELRPAVDEAVDRAGLGPAQRHVPCALALAVALAQVAAVIDPLVAVTLSMEVLFAMAKTVPMSRRALGGAAEGG